MSRIAVTENSRGKHCSTQIFKLESRPTLTSGKEISQRKNADRDERTKTSTRAPEPALFQVSTTQTRGYRGVFVSVERESAEPIPVLCSSMLWGVVHGGGSERKKVPFRGFEFG